MINLELLNILTNVRDEYILQAQELRSGQRKQLRLMHRKRIFLIAAVISLLLLLVGCAVVYVLNLQNMKIGEYNATIPSCEAEPSGQVISSDMISMQGFTGTPGYQAAKEWQDFLNTYDSDGTLLKNADSDDYQEPDAYMAYICYTQQMQDKIDEICRKYGLEILGPTVLAEDGISTLDALGIDTILAEDTGAVTNLYQGYYYQGGTFALEGETILSSENSPWIYPIDFQYRCVMKNAFDGVFLTVGNVDDYDQWNYTLADGTEVLLAISSEKTLMIADKSDYFVTVNVLNPRVGDIQRGEQSMDRAAMENFADTFCFDYTPHRVEIPVSTPTPTVGEPFAADTPARKAFQKALRTIHDELYWPELPDVGEIDLWEPGTIEDERFALFDVDGDGQEELLVSVSNTYTAGMCEIIYGYNPQTDGVRVEAQNYVAVTHYPGMLKVDASHSQGYAGDVLWPYTVQFYQEAKDAYEDAVYVDAWSKEITDYNPYEEMSYPEDIDTEQDGYVYLITENGQKQILNRADYQKWEAELFAGKEPLTIPWKKLTAENIGLEVQKAEDIARWGQDELLHEADFEFCAGKPGNVRLYGKQLNEYFFGASDAVVELEDGRAIPVDIQDGLMRWWGQTGIHYTESHDQSCGLILEDVNFDGYTDIGLQVSVTADNAPYVYWYYDPDADAYCFLNGFSCPLEVNSETERCTEEYHVGQTYYKVIYKVQEHHLLPEERWITEYIDGRPVTRKDDHVG